MSKKVYVFLADGFEEIEALTVVDLLRRAGAQVTTVSISDQETLIGRSRIPVIADAMWSEHITDDADMLVLPGGQPGTTYLGKHSGLRKQLKEAAAKDVYVTAICAAPTVLADHGILEGRKATCYPGLESQLKAAGAEVVTDKEVVKDGKVVTSRGAGTAMAFALKLIDVLFGDKAENEIKKSIVCD